MKFGSVIENLLKFIVVICEGCWVFEFGSVVIVDCCNDIFDIYNIVVSLGLFINFI